MCCEDKHPVKAPSHCPGAQGLSLGMAGALDTQHPSSFWGAQLLTQGFIQCSATLPVKSEAEHFWASALPLYSKENTPVPPQNVAREMLEHLCSGNMLKYVQPGQEKFLRKP